MIHIIKKEEPYELKKYRESDDINKSYKCFRGKNIIRNYLLEEQGYLCAYCMRAIGHDPNKQYKEVRIEHYKCQEKFEGQALDYYNMLAVCTYSEGLNQNKQHCDFSKKNRVLHINPLIKDHITTISYGNIKGNIESINTDFNNDLESLLKLNCDHLMYSRRDSLLNAIENMKKQIDRGHEIMEIIEKVNNIYQKKDKNGYKKPYCGIVINYCEKKMKELLATNV